MSILARPSTALPRLQQTLSHLGPSQQKQCISIVHGPQHPPLLDYTLSDLLRVQTELYGNRPAIAVPWTETAWTYADLNEEATRIARGLLSVGITHGDRIGIMAGNSAEYVAILFAAARIGAVLVVLNNTYTATELHYALLHTGCKLLFIAPRIGRHDNTPFLETHPHPDAPLENIITLHGTYPVMQTYTDLLAKGESVPAADLQAAEDRTDTHDLINLQFTSGSTGAPKATKLTHHNLVNNSRAIGSRMKLSPEDVLCCPPPLFHCFGLVLGLLACITHGASIVLPAETFDAAAVMRAIHDHKCTALHGVPTMFSAVLSLPRPEGWTSRLRTGIVAGAPAPAPLMRRMFDELGMHEYTNSYGLTEASPTCFNSDTGMPLHLRLATVGKVMPHISAKIVVPGTTTPVPLGERGELCVTGYSLSSGYWEAEEKTKEVFVIHEDGRRWLHTGDEACFDEEGYCTITGRLKDIIIRGGENLYPAEIEARLIEHPKIAAAAVVGVKDERYGEVVGAFVEGERIDDEAVREWVREKLARFKQPKYIFWVGGEDGVLPELPKTGSGKVLKPRLREVAEAIVNGEKEEVERNEVEASSAA